MKINRFYTLLGSLVLQVVKNLRILESEDDTEEEKPPLKKLKAEHDSTSENVLCKDFTEKPLHLIDKYLDTLATLYPHYDKMVGFHCYVISHYLK